MEGVGGAAEHGGKARDASLHALLVQHPNALVAAADAHGLFVEVPASVELLGHRVVEARSALDLVEPACRAAVMEAWEKALELGGGIAPVTLIGGAEASFYFIDVRPSHGVLMVILAADEHIELVAALAGREPVMPKSGRTDKDELAIIRFADDRALRMLGFTLDEIVGCRSLDLIHPDDQFKAIDAWMEMLSTPGAVTRLRARHKRGDGSWLWVELTNNNLLAGPEHSVVTEMIDIADEMSALEAVRQREQLLLRLADALPSGVLHIDRDRNVVYGNSQLHRVVGIGPVATLADQLAAVIPEDRFVLESSLVSVLVDGLDADLEVRLALPGETKIRYCSIAIRSLTDADDAPVGAVLCIDDVTEASVLRAELEIRATTDDLTGCLNRAAVLRELDAALAHHADHSPGTAVVFLDLDGFKEVNDTFGHTTGDRLLVSAADQLRSAMRSIDFIGRLGGDEFVVVLPAVRSIEEATRIGMRLTDALAQPVEIVGGLPTRIRSSIGVAWTDIVGVTSETLTAAADRAMYESKRAGTAEPVFVSL
ncbi:MAG: domain S-box-containing protein/diguanylate cyclase protein [Acidimicrobiales bacterium]|nr:domain S-box-containing protein/diguanylate cyclase protein [Acidimicrobiales bacterium]